MPRSTILELAQEEQAQMLAALWRARYGYLLALHILLLCTAGRSPTEIAAVLFCSRSSVVPHGARLSGGNLGLGKRRPGETRPAGAYHGAAPHAAAVADSPAQSHPTGPWLVPYALELRHAGPDVAG